jgi:hypothetical protein
MEMANNKTGKTSLAQRAAQLIAGAQKRFPKGTTTVTVGGATTTVTAAVNEIQTFIDNRDAVVAAQATAKAKIAAEKAALPTLTAFLNAFTATVRFLFGNDAEALADFGLAPHKARAPLTAEQKAVAAAKRKATREARGTKGPKAKADIHGNITAQLVVTPADGANGTPAPAAPAPAPAATPSGGATVSPAPTATSK